MRCIVRDGVALQIIIQKNMVSKGSKMLTGAEKSSPAHRGSLEVVRARTFFDFDSIFLPVV